MGIDPSTARRRFRAYYGLTFQAYQRARRMGLALHEVRAGRPVIDVQLDGGYESTSGFRAAFLRLFGKPPRGARADDCLLARRIDTPLGKMLALADGQGLRLLEFVDRRGLENEIAHLRRRLRCAVVPGTNADAGGDGATVAALFCRRTARVRPAAGAGRLAVPAEGVGGAAAHPARRHALLRADRGGGRPRGRASGPSAGPTAPTSSASSFPATASSARTAR